MKKESIVYDAHFQCHVLSRAKKIIEEATKREPPLLMAELKANFFKYARDGETVDWSVYRNTFIYYFKGDLKKCQTATQQAAFEDTIDFFNVGQRVIKSRIRNRLSESSDNVDETFDDLRKQIERQKTELLAMLPDGEANKSKGCFGRIFKSFKKGKDC